MKRLFPLLLMLLFLTPALAEETPESLFLAAHPGWEITDFDMENDIAIAILSQGNDRTLCIAERANGTWTLTIDNPKVLRDHEAYEYRVAVDPEQPCVSWECQPWDVIESCSATRKNGAWTLDSMAFQTPWGMDAFHIITLSWGNGKLARKQDIIDENGKIRQTEALFPLPAPRLESMTDLANFDVSMLPVSQGDTPTIMDGNALSEAAGVLLPDYTYVGGALLAQEMQLLMDKPDGTRVFVGVTYDGDWRITESTPLPAGTFYGYENFTDYLHIPDETTIGVRHWPDGTWGVDFLMPDNGDMMLLGRHRLSDSHFFFLNEHLFIGDLPWNDLTAIDWTSLPHTFDEARAAIDNSGWAMVNNPNPADRLHLREQPDRSSTSKGKYYNGTPVQVLERKGDWTRVNIFGVEGWMMSDYLAFGDDMEKVTQTKVVMYLKESLPSTTLYESPNGEALYDFRDDVLVLGMIGDEWFHVMLDSEETGYVRQEDFCPGNG